jgi:hypothetical protein
VRPATSSTGATRPADYSSASCWCSTGPLPLRHANRGESAAATSVTARPAMSARRCSVAGAPPGVPTSGVSMPMKRMLSEGRLVTSMVSPSTMRTDENWPTYPMGFVLAGGGAQAASPRSTVAAMIGRRSSRRCGGCWRRCHQRPADGREVSKFISCLLPAREDERASLADRDRVAPVDRPGRYSVLGGAAGAAIVVGVCEAAP